MKQWLSCCCSRLNATLDCRPNEVNGAEKASANGKVSVCMDVNTCTSFKMWDPNARNMVRGRCESQRIKQTKKLNTNSSKFFFLCFHSNWLQQCIRPIHYAFVSFVSTGAYVMLQSRPFAFSAQFYPAPVFHTRIVCPDWVASNVSVLSKSGGCKSCNETLFVHDIVRCMCAANK